MRINLNDRVSLVLLLINAVVGCAFLLSVVVAGCAFFFIGIDDGMDENIPNRFEVNLEPRKYNCREVKQWGYEDRYIVKCDRIK